VLPTKPLCTWSGVGKRRRCPNRHTQVYHRFYVPHRCGERREGVVAMGERRESGAGERGGVFEEGIGEQWASEDWAANKDWDGS
jgi:hypothetical protein